MKETILAYFRFFVSKRFLLHVAAAIALVILVIYVTLWWLKWSTNHGQELSVPDFTGIHMNDLDEFSDKHNLTYVIIDSIQIEGKEKGTVLSQSPRPTDSTGLYVKEGRKIYVTVVSTQQKLKVIPDFRSKPPRMVETLAEQYGFRIKTEYDRSKTEDKNRFALDVKYNGKSIYKQAINDDGEKETVQFVKKVPYGTELTVIYNWGKPEKATVPDLMDLTVLQAEDSLKPLELHLEPVFVGDFPTRADSLAGRVTNQNPKATNIVNVGTNVKVTIKP